MSLWTSSDIAKATGGKAAGDWAVDGVSIDTRTLAKGDLFVALKDARDGHEFIPAAMSAGASGALSEQDVDASVVVDDTLRALEDLGKAAIERSDALRIAVTGSVGKTSVKEALAVMFSGFGKTHKSLKSYNNHWGVPLTMARMPQETEFAIFEMGMNHAGELSALSKMAEPNIALITTVAPAHLAHFENIEAIADAKAEIMDGLAPGGKLILNADNAYTDQILKIAKAKNVKVMTFGQSDDCDVTIVISHTYPYGSNSRLRIKGQQFDATLMVPGEHWVSNAAACMCVALAAGVDLRQAVRRLRRLTSLAGRGEIFEATINGKSVRVMDESYNANPTSMAAAIAALGLQEGRKIAVLGDMLELGDDASAIHAALAENLKAAGVDMTIACGELMSALKGAKHVTTREDALRALIDAAQDGDVVLVKGSNASGMSKLVADLKSLSQVGQV